MFNIKEQLIKLGSQSPELREHLRPVIAELDKKAFRREVEHVTEKAVRAFWEEVHRSFSDARTDNRDKITEQMFESLAEDLVEKWAWNNVDKFIE